MKIALLSSVFLFLFNLSFAQSDNRVADTLGVKFKLTEYLLACQSIGHIIIGEKDPGMKEYLAAKGFDYHQKASVQYLELQDAKYGDLNPEVVKAVPMLLQLYEKMFTDLSVVNDAGFQFKATATYAVALKHTETFYKKGVLQGLWDKK